MGIGATSADAAAPVCPVTEKLAEIQEHLEGIRTELEQMPPIPADAMTYSELKMQLMVNYIANLSYYLSLKHKGEKSVGDHPVFKHLAFLRTFMERLAPLDASLKYQIDRLLIQEDHEDDSGEKTTGTTTGSSSAGPNLASFIPMKAAVKGISVEQVKKSLAGAHVPEGGSMEIDPSLIAARIAKMQQSGGNKKKTKRVSEDEEDYSDFSQEEEAIAPKKKSKKKQTKKPIDSDDESIDSEDI